MKVDKYIINFEELNWKQIKGLDKDKTIIFIPISPIEEHGPHLPIGTDYLTSRNLAIESIKFLREKNPSLKGLLFPAIPLGASKPNSDFPGTIHTSGKIIKEVIFSICSSLADDGFKYITICSWHLGFNHIKGIHQAINKVIKKYDIKIHEPNYAFFCNNKTNMWDEEIKKKGLDYNFDYKKQFHADFRETSIMIYKYPKLVDNKYKKLPDVYVNLLSGKKCRNKTFKELGIKEGYVGSPSNANKEYGELYFKKIADYYAETTNSLYKGEKIIQIPEKIKRLMKIPFLKK